MDQLRTVVEFDPFTLEDPGTDCITLDGFSEAVHRIINAAWGNKWGEYSEEEPRANKPEELVAPHVTFKMLERILDKHSSFRSTVVAEAPDPENPGFHLRRKRRILVCNISWTCYHKTNRHARLMSRKLEYFLENYVHYFKEHGLLQLVFQRETGVDENVIGRMDLPHMALVYNAYFDELAIERTKFLNDLQIRAAVIDPKITSP